MAEVAKSDRRQALDLAISSIDRQFGKGAIMRLGQGGVFDEISVIPTGALSLDVALGIGGIPRGRRTGLYGPESSGKTTLALHIIAEASAWGARPPSSTPSKPSTRSTPRTSASIPTSS